MKSIFSTVIISIILSIAFILTWTPTIKTEFADCSTGEGKRDCHSGFACSSNEDCVFKTCENFVCVRNLKNGCTVGGKKHDCNLGDPCASSDDCKTPGCEGDEGEDEGKGVCV
ncbi:25889_t:CDS:2 [Gigaspora rosea]|nr:25889_t:CDS:2 [Gigaspora rosea]